MDAIKKQNFRSNTRLRYALAGTSEWGKFCTDSGAAMVGFLSRKLTDWYGEKPE